MTYAAKKLSFIALAVTALSTPIAYADTDELVPALYFKIPFSAEARNLFEAPSLGFAMQYGSSNRTTGFQMRSDIPAFFDMSFKQSQLETFSFNGVNSLAKTMRMNADGSTETTTNINWGFVAGGVLVGAMVINELDDDDDTNTPPPPV